jgi:DNA polymerase
MVNTAEAAIAAGPTPGVLFSVEEPALSGPPLPTAEKRRILELLDQDQVKGCPKCRLCETRTNTVFGEGDFDAKLLFVGEGPGENEDLSGRPFVGRAGDKLSEMIKAMGLSREQVFICNVVKCRPPGNRAPAADEVAACTPYLVTQLETIRPRVIVTLGLPATQFLLKSKESMSRLRGRFHTWRGIKVMPTYHPAYILRNNTIETRRTVWGDLQLVMAELGLPLPRRGGESAGGAGG